MKYAIRSCCTLFLLTTSIAFSQSTTSSAAPGTAGMSGDSTTEANLQKMEIELAQADVARDPVPFTKYLDDDIIALGPGWSDQREGRSGEGYPVQPVQDDESDTHRLHLQVAYSGGGPRLL